MKKIIFILLMCVATLTATAQNTIKFLGIPVDGTKQEMIEQLQAKGFVYDSMSGYLTGEFNGEPSTINIQTVHNKVWRIWVMNTISYRDKTIAKNKFNTLLYHFLNNEKYIYLIGDAISENEDISYEITVNNKRYEAGFKPKDETINGLVWYILVKRFGGYNITIFYENPNNAANGEDL